MGQHSRGWSARLVVVSVRKLMVLRRCVGSCESAGMVGSCERGGGHCRAPGGSCDSEDGTELKRWRCEGAVGTETLTACAED